MFGFDAWAAALFTFLGIAVTAVFNFLTRKQKQDNENSQQLFQNVFTQMGVLQNRIEVLEREREELIIEIKELMDEINVVKFENAQLKAENKILKEKIEQLEKNKR
jgi:peptidoglycan hydrolase CwlO-like protein